MERDGSPKAVFNGHHVSKPKQPAMLSADNWQSPGHLPTYDAAQLDGPQRTLEEGTRDVLSALAQAMQAAQLDAFRQIRSQFSHLALENVYLREQLGEAVAKPSHQSPSRSNPPAKPTMPSGECAILDHVEAFTIPNTPNTLHTETFAEPESIRRPEAWRIAEGCDLRTSSLTKRVGLPKTLDDKDRPASRSQQKCAIMRMPTSEQHQQQQMQGMHARRSRQRTSTAVQSHVQAHRRASATFPAPNASWIGNALQQMNRGRIFPHKTDLMKKVQDTLAKPEYKVSNYYYKEGVAQLLASSHVFEIATLAVIVLNSVWIAIDTDHNTDPLRPPLVFVVVENLFCAYFTLELLIRFLAFEKKRDCLKDGWFVFDSILVVIAVLETWVMALISLITGENSANLTGQSGALLRLLRMARLARTARMARLLRAVPALMIMFKGMAVASHAVVCTIFLLAIIIYIFALCFRQLTEGSELGASHFRTVPRSMGTLLLRGTLPDAGDFVEALSSFDLLLAGIGLCFVLLATLVVLNMLAGVLVNVVLVVADIEKEEAEATFVKNALPMIMDLGDMDGDQLISKSEFDQLLVNPEATKVLEQVNVDIMGLVELSDFIFSDQDTLQFEDFFKLLLKLRGTNKATVKDIVEMRKFIVQEISLLETSLAGMFEDVCHKFHRMRHSSADLT